MFLEEVKKINLLCLAIEEFIKLNRFIDWHLTDDLNDFLSSFSALRNCADDEKAGYLITRNIDKISKHIRYLTLALSKHNANSNKVYIYNPSIEQLIQSLINFFNTTKIFHFDEYQRIIQDAKDCGIQLIPKLKNALRDNYQKGNESYRKKFSKIVRHLQILKNNISKAHLIITNKISKLTSELENSSSTSLKAEIDELEGQLERFSQLRSHVDALIAEKSCQWTLGRHPFKRTLLYVDFSEKVFLLENETLGWLLNPSKFFSTSLRKFLEDIVNGSDTALFEELNTQLSKAPAYSAVEQQLLQEATEQLLELIASQAGKSLNDNKEWQQEKDKFLEHCEPTLVKKVVGFFKDYPNKKLLEEAKKNCPQELKTLLDGPRFLETFRIG